MKVTILGSGYSMGVPTIGCDCEVCKSDDPKNKRKRASVFIEVNGANLLIDVSTDFRQQMLENNITRIDSILYTHEHADHISGTDDLRPFSVMQEKEFDIFSDQATIDSLKSKLPHLFQGHLKEWGWYKLSLIPNVVDAGKVFEASGVEVLPFEQTHGKYTSLGFRIADFAYTTDVSDFSEENFENELKDLDVWVVDCQSYSKSLTHSHLERTLGWIERAKPKRAILTHMGHEFDYNKLSKELPEGVEPAYDNMVITV